MVLRSPGERSDSGAGLAYTHRHPRVFALLYPGYGALMMGHRNNDMHSLSISANLKRIQEKLGIHASGGVGGALEGGIAPRASKDSDRYMFAKQGKKVDRGRYSSLEPQIK